ncbi:MAG: cation:proton antiporter, partial [Bacteriovoracaceae bacterium]|nr:cation:proton antiporter [Bacteriovoracaceae bacterium]
SLLLLLAVAAGTLTKKLGAYYLVGAFLVGFTVNFYEQIIAQDPRREFEHATKFFSGFFMPFYFFYAGMKLDSSIFTLQSLWMGLALVVAILPIRLASVVIHRKWSLKEKIMDGLPISISLLPTLVFGIVLVEIIKATGSVSPHFIGALIVYTIFSTLFPSFFLSRVLKRNDLVNVADPTLTPKSRSIFIDPRL